MSDQQIPTPSAVEAARAALEGLVRRKASMSDRRRVNREARANTSPDDRKTLADLHTEALRFGLEEEDLGAWIAQAGVALAKAERDEMRAATQAKVTRLSAIGVEIVEFAPELDANPTPENVRKVQDMIDRARAEDAHAVPAANLVNLMLERCVNSGHSRARGRSFTQEGTYVVPAKQTTFVEYLVTGKTYPGGGMISAVARTIATRIEQIAALEHLEAAE